MNNKIPQIRQELERRFNVCTDTKTAYWGFLVSSQDYIDFVNNTPILTQIIESAMKNLEQGVRGSSNNPFNPIFPKLFAGFTEETKRLVTEHKVIKKESFWNSLLKKINSGSGRTRYEHHKLMTLLKLIHDNLMKALSAHEIGPVEYAVTKTTEITRALGIKEDTNWKLLTISFTTYYDVKITYGEKQCTSNHEKMGFSDKRQPDETHPVDCWRLLQLLAIGNGIFKLPHDEDERDKFKTQKQKLTKKLKEYFQITEDPFYPFQRDQSEYRIKIRLIATPEFREDYRDRHISDITSRPELLKRVDSL